MWFDLIIVLCAINHTHILGIMAPLCRRHRTLHKRMPLHKPIVFIIFLILLSFLLLLLHRLCMSAVSSTPSKSPWYWTEIILQLKLMQGVFSDTNAIHLFNDILQHKLPLQAISSPIPRIGVN